MSEICKGQEGIANGIKKLTDVVKTTMGPKGKNVVLDKGIRSPIVTNDGVTVVNEIVLKDEVENTGALMLKEACGKTNSQAGDGTTTTAVVTNAIVQEGLLHIGKGVNPFKLSEHMTNIGKQIISKIEDNKKDIKGVADVKNVATISSQDEEVGIIISDIYKDLDSNMVVTLEKGNTMGVSSEIKKGCQFNTGYISPYFVTDLAKKEAKLENPFVFITDKDLKTAEDITDILNTSIYADKKELLIIAGNVVGQALASLVVNKFKGVINVIAVKAPGFGDNKTNFLEDIAILTGGRFIRKDEGLAIKEITADMLGSIESVVSLEKETTLINGGGDQSQVDDRVKLIKKAIKECDSDFDKKQLQERLSKLLGGVGVIRVLAPTEMETVNKMYKIEDAVNATKSAIEEGVVIGSGCAYINALKDIVIGLSEEEKIAKQILSNALEAPFKQIMENAGINKHVAIENQRSSGSWTHGVGVDEGAIAPLMKRGVIDSVKVLRVALENSISTAMMVLNSSYTIYNKKEDAKVHPDSVY